MPTMTEICVKLDVSRQAVYQAAKRNNIKLSELERVSVNGKAPVYSDAAAATIYALFDSDKKVSSVDDNVDDKGKQKSRHFTAEIEFLREENKLLREMFEREKEKNDKTDKHVIGLLSLMAKQMGIPLEGDVTKFLAGELTNVSGQEPIKPEKEAEVQELVRPKSLLQRARLWLKNKL